MWSSVSAVSHYSDSVMTLHRITQTQVPRSPHKSAKSAEKSPEPRWVAHCLDSFTEQRQENSIPQFIHRYCDECLEKVLILCLHFQTGMFGHKTVAIH